jgi:hypothetical protein
MLSDHWSSVQSDYYRHGRVVWSQPVDDLAAFDQNLRISDIGSKEGSKEGSKGGRERPTEDIEILWIKKYKQASMYWNKLNSFPSGLFSW